MGDVKFIWTAKMPIFDTQDDIWVELDLTWLSLVRKFSIQLNQVTLNSIYELSTMSQWWRKLYWFSFSDSWLLGLEAVRMENKFPLLLDSPYTCWIFQSVTMKFWSTQHVKDYFLSVFRNSQKLNCQLSPSEYDQLQIATFLFWP